MNNHDLAVKIAQRLQLAYEVVTTDSEMPVSEEELAAAIEDEIEANGD